jgi:hypothetical protein
MVYREKTWTLVRGIGLAVCLSIASIGWGSEAQTGRMVLTGTNVVSLGTYPAAQERTARVAIRNVGKGELHLVHVIATCSCMRVDAFPETLVPGASGEIAVTLRGGELSGAFERVFYIETDDPDNRCLKVKVQGNAER